MPRTKEIVGKRQCSVVIALVYTIDSKIGRTRMVINITLRAGTERRLALQMDLVKLGGSVTQLVSPEGRKIYSYRDHLVQVAATDTIGKQ